MQESFFVRKPPPGRARFGAGDYRAAAAAASFGGLPASLSHPKQLLEPLRAAGRHLPFPRCALDTLAFLLDHTKLEDWRPGGRPVVWPGNARIAQATGLSIATVNRHLAWLRAASALKLELGPGNRRQPVRDSTGRIVELYGLDLSPLADLHRRMVEVARHQAERGRAMRSIVAGIRCRADLARQHEDAASAAGAGPDEPECVELSANARHADALIAEARMILRRDARVDEEGQSEHLGRLAAIDTEIRMVETRSRALAEAIVSKALDEKTICAHPSNETHNTTSLDHPQDGILYGYAGDVPSRSVDNSRWEKGDGNDGASPDLFPFVPESQKPAMPPPRWNGRLLASVSPTFASVFAQYRTGKSGPESADLDDLRIVGRIAALRLGLSDVSWSRAVDRHGEVRAALCALVAGDRPAHEIRTSRAQMLAGMYLKRAEDLNPLASLFGMAGRRSAEPAVDAGQRLLC